MSNTVLQSQVVIKNDLISKHPWYPEVQECEGKTFIKLERVSREFTRYCAGRSVDLRKSKAFSLNGTFLNQIVKERNAKSTEAYHEACSIDDVNPSKTKKRRVSEGDSIVCPTTVWSNFHLVLATLKGWFPVYGVLTQCLCGWNWMQASLNLNISGVVFWKAPKNPV